MLRIFNLNITILLVFAFSAAAQQDSVINTKHADFSFYKNYTAKLGEINNDTTMNSIRDIENIESVKFLNNDSLILINYSSHSFRTHLNSVIDVKFKQDATYWGEGLILGTALGALIGGGIGSLYETEGFMSLEGLPTTFGALVGLLSGALIGTIIGVNINHYETLNLLEIPGNNKKAELIKFIRQRR